ncbi:YwmB family TATA-box binding protein [Thermoanaerobacterium thermosaccharolyticum]|uniref:TATA-box binding protein n=1 Tax=Thermoanaerobacterium thermosaccharolyticum M0795 TaxID=698948 RepID=L0IQ64_THETR|nr:YwmB family TATA-box binding protein [Thermoanaerobacterium thermosaccharolyticum]AGB20142.1 Protein of unknown function (DUF1779) [Thermoanaerobacterium thermosaccharolyticum M0795]
MFNKLSLIIVTILIVFVMLNSQMDAFSAKSNDIAVLENSFEKSGASYEYANINAWSKLNSKFTSISEMNMIVEKIIKSMGIDDKKVKVSKLDQDNFRQYDAEYDTGNKKVSIVMQSVKNEVDNETYILIDEYLLKGNKDVIGENEKIIKAYSKLSLTPEIATCLVGAYKGLLNKGKISSILEEVMKDTNAVKVEGLNDENLVSISAHTNKIKEYIEMGSEKINLNVALRYSSFDDKTYIWIATPIIAIEY